MSFEHFVAAQDPVYEAVEAELGAGRKRTHWMWFIFPQIAGLGQSPMSRRFALSSAEEAGRYLDHAVLGPRLYECTGLVNAVEGRSISEIFGYPDDLKFRSSMTLFAHAGRDAAPFRRALDKYFAGAEDPETLRRL